MRHDIKKINLKHKDNPSEEPSSSAEGMSKIMDPSGTRLFLKVSEVVYRYKLQQDGSSNNSGCEAIRMFYAINEVQGE